jgi:RIO kinase 1
LDTTLDHAALDYFYAEGWISQVLYLVKSGKEATVYCCEAQPSTGQQLLAAKLYRAREHRAFRNDAVYQAGRVILDAHARRAVKNKSRFGREAQQGMWINHEWETLEALHAVGADVPEPLARTEGAILMGYRGDETASAPRLHEVNLPRDEAGHHFQVLMRNVELWLANNVIHGDLSAYNVLYWQGAVTVIDFPQAVDPRFNPNATSLLERDVTNLCNYFAKHGVSADAKAITRDLWRRFLRAEL